jgi:fibronectin-binding autotransporter adhesin
MGASITRTGRGVRRRSRPGGGRLFAITLAFVLVPIASSLAPGQSTWQGAGADSNWSSAGNFDVTPSATGSTLVFDGLNQLTNVNNLVTSTNGITYQATAGAFVSTAASPVTSLTIAGNVTNNSAATQTLSMATAISGARTVSVVEDGVMVFGGTGSNFAHTVNDGTTALTGDGEVRYVSNATGSFRVGQLNTTTVNASGLATFTANVGTLSVYGTASSTATLRLARNSSLTAGSLRIGDTLGGTTVAVGVLRLGEATAINASTINLGSTRSSGTINFDTGWASPVVTIKGAAGGTAKADMTLGWYQTSPGAYNPTGTADFTNGTVNAQLGTLVLGRQTPGSVNVNNNTAGGSWAMAAGTVAADTVRLGWWSGGTTTGSGTTQLAAGTLTISGGSFTAGVLQIGDGAVGGTNTHARGTVAVSGGALTVNTTFLLGNDAGGGASNNQRGTLSITGGQVTSSVALTTNNAQSTLTLNGGTLDMGGNAIGTALQKIGSNGGALTFQAGTLRNVSEINGGDPFVKSGAGTLILAGTNGFSGGTSVDAGTLAVTTANALGTGNVTVANGARLQLDVSPALGGGAINLLAGSELVTTGGISAPLAAGASLTGWRSTSTGGTAASLLQSTAFTATTFATGWDTNPGDYLSDILTLSGTTASVSNVMVLSMAYDPAYSGALTDLNIFTRPNSAGAFAAVGSSFEGVGVPWTASFQTPGQYGVSDGRVWAVTDANSQFVVDVMAVPEPGALAIAAWGSVAAGLYFRRRRLAR